MTGKIGNHLCLVGRFKLTDYDAQEDVVVSLIQNLILRNGRCIYDYKYYSMKSLEQKMLTMTQEMQTMKDDKLQLQMQLSIVSDQVRELNAQLGEGR